MLVLAFLSFLWAEESASEIIDRANAHTDAGNISAEVEMVTTAANGSQRRMKAEVHQKERADGTDRLVVIKTPPDARDTALLVQSKGDQDAVWMYSPDIKKIKRISLENSGHQTFMGSDFTYGDFVVRDKNDYSYALISTDEMYYVVEVVGTADVQNRTGYSKEVHYIRKADYVRERILFYDLNGDLLKEMTVLQWHVEKGYIYPTHVIMHNHQDDHTSEVVVTGISFADEIPDSLFTHRYLKKRNK